MFKGQKFDFFSSLLSLWLLEKKLNSPLLRLDFVTLPLCDDRWLFRDIKPFKTAALDFGNIF